MMPLMVLLPPRPRPRQKRRWGWPSTLDAVSVGHWNRSNFSVPITWLGLSDRISTAASVLRQSGPASSSNTRLLGRSVSRAASTHPADPPPTITQSKAEPNAESTAWSIADSIGRVSPRRPWPAIALGPR